MILIKTYIRSNVYKKIIELNSLKINKILFLIFLKLKKITIKLIIKEKGAEPNPLKLGKCKSKSSKNNAKYDNRDKKTTLKNKII